MLGYAAMPGTLYGSRHLEELAIPRAGHGQMEPSGTKAVTKWCQELPCVGVLLPLTVTNCCHIPLAHFMLAKERVAELELVLVLELQGGHAG
jgi:hypothetical protein